MTSINAHHYETQISSEETQIYIIQMLDELSTMALSSGLKEMVSLLKATSMASKVDVELEADS